MLNMLIVRGEGRVWETTSPVSSLSPVSRMDTWIFIVSFQVTGTFLSKSALSFYSKGWGTGTSPNLHSGPIGISSPTPPLYSLLFQSASPLTPLPMYLVHIPHTKDLTKE